MVDLASPMLDRSFVAKLAICESRTGDLTDYDGRFVRELRERYDSRAAAKEFGIDPWSPTRKQWNHLATLATDLVNG